MGRRVHAWLRMQPAQVGDFAIPTSEADYRAHYALVDDVLVTGGGVIQADGSWYQPVGTQTPFYQELKALAHSAGQRYIPVFNPGHGTDKKALYAVLDDAKLQAKAINAAMELALTRFDAPWDVIGYDAVDVDRDHLEKQGAFMIALADAAHRAGLSFLVSYRGVRAEDEPVSLSLDVIRQVADEVNYYPFGWWLAPCSVGPYWWYRASLDNALAHGVNPRDIHLGIANFARYWPQGYGVSYDITHDQAMRLAKDNGTKPQWLENHPTGLIREKYAAIGDTGHLWVQDGDTVRARLALVDEYGLGGIMLFVLGCGDESAWQAIAEWKRLRVGTIAARPSTKRPKNGNDHCALLGYGGLLAVEA